MKAGWKNRQGVAALALALTCALSAPLAQAGPWDRGYGSREQREYRQQRESRQNEDNRQYERRQDSDSGDRQHRLSPEERRSLRQDIRDAGRELYPRRR